MLFVLNSNCGIHKSLPCVTLATALMRTEFFDERNLIAIYFCIKVLGLSTFLDESIKISFICKLIVWLLLAMRFLNQDLS